nr:uncharacterized protein LOC117849198 [Setaria viridis]
MRRNNNICFDYGKPGHFTTDCPDKNKCKSGYDYNKLKNKDSTKKKKKKDVDSDTDDHTDSSSSEEDDDSKVKRKDGKNFNGLCFYSGKNCNGYCVMALNTDNKKDDKERDSNTETESQIDDACAKIKALEKSEIPVSTECLEFRNALQHAEDENLYLRTILSWVSSREPQLGEHEIRQSIFKEEDEHADVGDEEDDEVNRAPTVAPVPPTSTTMVDGPTSTTTTSSHQRVPLHADEEEGQSDPAVVEGEATSERAAPGHVQRNHPPQ